MATILLLLVMGAVSGVTSICPTLANTPGLFQVKVRWIYDMWNNNCTARKEGSSAVTSFTQHETKSIAGLGNDCLMFTCGGPDGKEVFFNHSASSCAFNSGCSQDVKQSDTCSEPYTCYSAIDDQIAAPYFDDFFYKYKKGWFTVFSGYTCGARGSGTCNSTSCFNPYADTSKSSTHGEVCVAQGDNYVTAEHVRYTCSQRNTCSNNSYVDLTLLDEGCDNNGSYVPLGSVTWSDACQQTSCDVTIDGRQLVTSFKDHEGCGYGDQCVPVGETIAGTVNYVCANLTCRKNESLTPAFYFDTVYTGCYSGGQCYAKGKKVDTDVACKQLICKKKTTTGEYIWGNKFKGCYNYSTNECTYTKGQSYEINGCIKNRCVTNQYAAWKTTYKNNGDCVPKKKACSKRGVPGCKHGTTCYPVKSVVTMDNCTQFVCYSDDPGLNNGTYTEGTPSPQWKPRATGCYGPKGCMQFGEQWRDPNSKNTYRCDYQLGGLEFKYAQFHKACVAPNGTTLALGESVLIGDLWHSCYRYGKMKVPIDRTTKPTTTYTCGQNPDTGGLLYTKLNYFTPEAKCKKVGTYCRKTCDYFDQPCTNVTEKPYRWRYLGDKFSLSGSECVCTQDYEVNNKPIPFAGSLFNTPSLCGEQGVTGAACRDPNDSNVLRQWGEMWNVAGSKPLQICACHPLKRNATCHTYLPDAVDTLMDMQI